MKKSGPRLPNEPKEPYEPNEYTSPPEPSQKGAPYWTKGALETMRVLHIERMLTSAQVNAVMERAEAHAVGTMQQLVFSRYVVEACDALYGGRE